MVHEFNIGDKGLTRNGSKYHITGMFYDFWPVSFADWLPWPYAVEIVEHKRFLWFKWETKEVLNYSTEGHFGREADGMQHLWLTHQTIQDKVDE